MVDGAKTANVSLVALARSLSSMLFNRIIGRKGESERAARAAAAAATASVSVVFVITERIYQAATKD